MQPDRVGRDRRLALVRDRLAVDQREGAQRRHRLVEAVAGERRGERLAEFLPRLREQEQRDRLRRQQRGVHDQRLGGGMELRRLLDGEREGLRHRQAVVILGRRMARVVEQSRRGGLEAPAVLGQRDVEPLAIGRRLLVRERQARRAPPTAPAPPRARPRGRCARSGSRRRSPSATAGFRPARRPRARRGRST